MATVEYGDVQVVLEESETVLDGLLRAGVDTPSSCKAGACQSCMVRALSGDPPSESQLGLMASLVRKGYFLACAARPEGDLVVGPAAEDDVAVSAVIAAVEPLSETVARVQVRLDEAFEFSAGQFVNLVREDGLTRSYSIASLPGGGELELHVRKIEGGRMSGWLCGGEAVGARVQVRGPAGDCFYPGDPDEPLLLAGAGTGLAPLLGIVRDAVRNRHRGPVALHHGAVETEGLYLRDDLHSLASEHDFLEYRPCVLRGPAPDGVQAGALDSIVIARYAEMSAARIYLCGDPDLVNGMRRKLYLAGADLHRIHADAFLSAPA